MVEKIEELRKLCKKEKQKKRTPIQKVYHETSLYLVKGLLYTPLNANQISSLGIIFGGLSSIFFAYANNISLIFGILFLNLWRAMDSCDGKVARYRGTVGGIGGNLDWLNIRIVPHVLFPCIGIGISIRMECSYPLIIGVLVSLLWFLTHTLRGVRIQFYDLLKRLKKRNSHYLLKKLEKKQSILLLIGKALKVDLTGGKKLDRGILYKLGDAEYISVGVTIFAIIDIIASFIKNSTEGIFLLMILTYFLIIFSLGNFPHFSVRFQ